MNTDEKIQLATRVLLPYIPAEWHAEFVKWIRELFEEPRQ